MNTESAERQYALRQRAVAFGWPAERIVVIDTDQGQSGASAADREGFQQLVAEVGMGQAGIVLGLEVSRLARNNADWHRLLEICALAGTLICDEDGLYDPADFNDRLLLGLKGTMSEAELHFIRARLQGGILSKARRGELQMPLPVGLVYDPAGKVVLDPDAGVQHALRHLFETFARTGSARAVVKAFNRRGPAVPRQGPQRRAQGRARLDAAAPLAGAAHAAQPALCRRVRLWPPAAPARAADGKTTVTRPAARAVDGADPRRAPRLPHLRAVRGATCARSPPTPRRTAPSATAGPAREGPALLQGLAVCGRCGRRMTVRYHHAAARWCPTTSACGEYIQAARRTLPGRARRRRRRRDRPAAARHRHAARARGRAHRPGRARGPRRRGRPAPPQPRRPRPPARRARPPPLPRRRPRQPARRRHARGRLERLAARSSQAAQDDYERASRRRQGRARPTQHKQRIRPLAADFPTLWSDPHTPQRERKRIARLLIEDVTLAKTDQIHLHVRFRGGQTTTLTIPIPPNSWQARQTDPATLALLDRLLDDHTDAETAAELNAAGHRSGEGKPFTPRIVLGLRRAHNLPSHRERLRARGLLTIGETAERLGVHASTIKAWHRAGLLESHKANDKNERLYRAARTRRPAGSSNDKAGASPTENPPNPAQEVHYETNALS